MPNNLASNNRNKNHHNVWSKITYSYVVVIEHTTIYILKYRSKHCSKTHKHSKKKNTYNHTLCSTFTPLSPICNPARKVKFDPHQFPPTKIKIPHKYRHTNTWNTNTSHFFQPTQVTCVTQSHKSRFVTALARSAIRTSHSPKRCWKCLNVSNYYNNNNVFFVREV